MVVPMMMNFLTLLLSTCCLCYVFILARAMSLCLHQEVFWLSLALGGFFSAGCAGFFFWMRRSKTDKNSLIFIEMGQTTAGALAVPFMYLSYCLSLYIGETLNYYAGLFLFFSLYLFVVLFLGLCSGGALFLLSRGNGKDSARNEIVPERLRFHFTGFLLSVIVFVVFCWLRRELFVIGFWLGLLNLGIVWVLIFILRPHEQNRTRNITAASILLFLLTVALVRQASLEQYFLKKLYFVKPVQQIMDVFRLDPEWQDITRYRTSHNNIDIVPFNPNPFDIWLLSSYSRKYLDNPAYPWAYFILLNHQLLQNAQWDEFHHEYFIHVPIILQGQVPRKVLILGNGGGLLLKDLIQYDSIESITCVERDPEIMDFFLSHSMMQYMGSGSLGDPRVEIVDEEGLLFMQDKARDYDAIYITSPDVSGYEFSQYYSQEFFRFIGEHLNENGFIVIDPKGIVGPGPETVTDRRLNPWPKYLSTLMSSGYKTIVPYAINLEPDNPKILEKIGIVLYGRDFFASGSCDPQISSCVPEEEKLHAVKRIVSSFVKSFRQGFIFMKKKETPLYSDVPLAGVPWQVLNQNRVDRALAWRPAFPESFDSTQVNSLLRPTLPVFRLRSLLPISE